MDGVSVILEETSLIDYFLEGLIADAAAGNESVVVLNMARATDLPKIDFILCSGVSA